MFTLEKKSMPGYLFRANNLEFAQVSAAMKIKSHLFSIGARPAMTESKAISPN